MGMPIRWLGILLLALALAACARTSPEARLREAVDGLQAGIEQRDVQAVQSFLAEDFAGPDGLDREGARRLAQVLFLRHRDVALRLGPQETKLVAGHASVRFTAAATGGDGSLLPDAAQLYDVELGWREEGGDWRLTSASWKPALQGSR